MSKNNIEKTLEELHPIKSESGKYSREIVELVGDRLNKEGIKSKLEEIKNDNGESFYSLIAYKNNNSPKTITLLGHLDVVPADNDEQWKFKKDKDWYFGRGVADDKGGCAVAIEYFIDANLEELTSNLRLILTNDEEIGGLYGAKEILKKSPGKKEDLVIAIEPFGNKITYEHYGVLRFEVLFENNTSHTKTGGENSIRNYIGFTKAIDEFAHKLGIDGNNEGSIVSPVYLSGPDGASVGYLDKLGQNPGYLKAIYDIRSIPEIDVGKCYEQLELLAKENKGITDIRKRVDGPSLTNSIDNEWIQYLLNKGYSPEISKGSTDAKWVVNETAIVLGPEGYGIHGPNEKVAIKSLPRFYDLLKDLSTK